MLLVVLASAAGLIVLFGGRFVWFRWIRPRPPAYAEPPSFSDPRFYEIVRERRDQPAAPPPPSAIPEVSDVLDEIVRSFSYTPPHLVVDEEPPNSTANDDEAAAS